MTTSWRRLSDKPQNHADAGPIRGAHEPRLREQEARQVQAWEEEGGRTALCAEPARILIVDNDIRSADSLQLMLHASGYAETRVAYSGHAALAIAAGFRPSVVLLELDLLDMSGREVARLLREHAPSHDLRLIALTSSRELAGVAGFERHLLKPVAALDLSELLQPSLARTS